MTPETSSASGDVLRWMDAPWLIAASLGIWGAMLGIEHFSLANASAGAALVFAAFRLGKDTLIWTKHRRTFSFVFWLFVFLALFGVDIWWTGQLKIDAFKKSGQLDKLGEIPQLHQTIEQMKAEATTAETNHKVDQGKLVQKMADIGSDNTRLKTSIEKKDAVLAKIAQEQYELNFAPQLMVSGDVPIPSIRVQNQGKTNVDIEDVDCPPFGHLDIRDKANPASIAPNSWAGWGGDDTIKRLIVQNAPLSSDGKVRMECTMRLRTMNNKLYEMRLTEILTVSNGEITGNVAVGHPAIEAKQ